MERRDFFKTVLATSLLAPLFLSAKKAKSDLELYLIGDEAEIFLPAILDELKKSGIASSGDFTFADSPPDKDALKQALLRGGWKHVLSPLQADLTLSFCQLRQKALPSFTLIKEGNIWDARARKLYSLWKEMNERYKPSSCMTIASFQKRKPSLSPGEFVSISKDGRVVERFSLKKNFSGSFKTKRGKVEVMVKEGRAWIARSSCRHKICLYSSPVSLAGERIICAPNQFLLEIQGARSIDTVIG
jgi:hypothetical protein